MPVQVPLQVDGAALLRLIWQLNGQDEAVNVVGIDKGLIVDLPSTIVQAIATEMSAAGPTLTILPLLNAGITMTRIGLRDINTENLPEFTAPVTGWTGTSVDDLLPRQTSLVVTVRTPFAGRRFRGRFYQWGWAENANESGGVASEAARAGAEQLFSVIRNAVQTVGLSIGVISRPVVDRSVDPPVITRPGLVTPMETWEVRDLIWDTQRRRAHPGI